MKLYEKEKEWKAENESLKLRVKSANDDLHKCKLLLEKCQDVSFIYIVYLSRSPADDNWL